MSVVSIGYTKVIGENSYYYCIKCCEDQYGYDYKNRSDGSLCADECWKKLQNNSPEIAKKLIDREIYKKEESFLSYSIGMFFIILIMIFLFTDIRITRIRKE